MIFKTQNEPFSISGEWFLPDKPQKVSGTLSYSPDKTELALDKAFSPPQGEIRADSSTSYPVIYGATKDAELVTVFHAYQAGLEGRFGAAGFNYSERIITNMIVFGAHLPSGYLYPEMRFRIPGLQVWLSQPILQLEIEQDGNNKIISESHKLNIAAEEKYRIEVISAFLQWGYVYEAMHNPFTSSSFKVTAWVSIHPDKPQELSWFLDQHRKLVAFLTFIAGTPMSADCIQSIIGDQRHKIEILVGLRDASYCSYLDAHKFYLLKPNLGDKLQAILAGWYEKYPSISMACQLAISVLASEKLWIHIEFLSLIQALEGFHRALFSGNYMDKSTYEATRNSLNNAIPAELSCDHKEALRSRIKWGYQHSLGKRLDELAAQLPEPMRLAIFGGVLKVPRNWVDTRNYYTHWDEDEKASILDSQGIQKANIRLRYFLRALYLNLMEVPHDVLINALHNLSEISQQLAYVNIVEYNKANPENKTGLIMSISKDDSKEPK